MSALFVMLFLAQVLRISVPYVLAALGGALSERSGVINLALEGMLLGGAFAATLGAAASNSVVLGLVAGAVGGLLVAALFAAVTIRGGADQVVAGVAVNLLVLGLTRYLLKRVFGSASSSPTVAGFSSSLAETVFCALVGLVVLGLHLWFARTPGGLRTRAVGEHPKAAASLGIDVDLTRARAVLASGLLAGAGGAWLAMSNHGFVDQMSGGRGYIAVAAVIFGRWRPVGATLACLLFGFAEALQLNLQSHTTFVPRELVQVFPYLVTLVALAGVIGRSRAPAALGQGQGE